MIKWAFVCTFAIKQHFFVFRDSSDEKWECFNGERRAISLSVVVDAAVDVVVVVADVDVVVEFVAVSLSFQKGTHFSKISD